MKIIWIRTSFSGLNDFVLTYSIYSNKVKDHLNMDAHTLYLLDCRLQISLNVNITF